MDTTEISQKTEQTEPQYKGTATYSPEDNKLRFYPFARLSPEDYAKIKEAGFIWAPRQNFFVTPMWTPGRADLMEAWTGEIGDEDSTLMQRAEERAERFENYSENRGREANAAHATVDQIMSGIPLGQPILVGHHSERRHRRDIERIDNGMRKAVKLWETRNYWKARAQAAQAHAAYKEEPAVRYRRIKKLEADKRIRERQKQKSENYLKQWLDCEAEKNAELQKTIALHVAALCYLNLPRKEEDNKDYNYRPTAWDALNNSHPNLYAPRTLTEIIETAKRVYPRNIAYVERWITHYENRIAYEKAMLGEQGGLAGQSFDIQPGGRIQVRRGWETVLRVNKKDGQIISVTAFSDSGDHCVYGIEHIKKYEAPTAERAARVAKITTLPPLINYPGEGFMHLTKEQYKKIHKDYKSTITFKATETTGAYRVRYALASFALKDQQGVDQQYGCTRNVFLTDSKRIDPPALACINACAEQEETA